MGAQRQEARDAMVGRGERRHKCETCGIVFMCGHCTEAMHLAQFDSSKRFINDLSFSILYGTDHIPRGPMLQVRSNKHMWLCDQCK